MNSRPIYNKIFTRDFTLCVMEIWWRAEAINPKLWTEKKQPFLPYIVFEKNETGVVCYYDKRGIDWVKKELIINAKKDPSFVSKIEKEFSNSHEKIKNVFKKEIVLSQSDLVNFLKTLESCWIWFEAGWWLWGMTPEERKDIEMTESIFELREKTQDFVPESERLIRNSLRKIFPSVAEYVEVLKQEEIISGSIPSMKILEDRMKGYFLTDNQVFVSSAKEDIESKFSIVFETEEIPKNTTSLKGETGFSGKVQGKVKIVFTSRQMGKVENGDILVSAMTLPSLLPAMLKAAAFITDEGGITSHAAIMAREMKKPCIVGTKYATKVLKDGDMVEVDAERGIVTILSKVQ